FLVRTPRPDKLEARHLEAFVQVIEPMKDGIIIFELEDRAIGEDAPQASGEILPFRRAVEVVDHEKTSAVEVLADPPGLPVIQLPVANLDRIEPWPLENLVAID